MMNEMIAAFDLADEDDAVRAVIVTGAGRGFCAGADLGAGGDTFNDETRGDLGGNTPTLARRDGGGVLVLRIFDSKKPVIGAINGSAVGVGLTMTLPMDVRILADNAKLGFVFAGRGIAPDGAASWFLPRVVGISQALEWVLTARVFQAQEALDAGLVKQVLPAAEVLPGRQGAGPGDRRRRGAGVRRRVPRPAVAHARRRPPDGRPPRRLGRHRRARPQGRLQGGRDGVPREAHAGLEAQAVRGHAVVVPVLGLPDVRRRLISAAARCASARC